MVSLNGIEVTFEGIVVNLRGVEVSFVSLREIVVRFVNFEGIVVNLRGVVVSLVSLGGVGMILKG
jgi:hypothetical protein